MILTAVLLVCTMASCSQKNTDVPDGMKIATCEGEVFRIYIPDAWTSTVDAGISGGYALSSVRSNVSMASYESELDAAEFLVEITSDFGVKYEDFTLVEEGSGAIGEKGASSAIYTFTDGGASLKILLMAAKGEGVCYLYTYVADVSLYDRYLDTATDIASKVKFDVPYVNDSRNDMSVKAPEGMKQASSDDKPYTLFVPDYWVVKSGNITAAYVESDKANVSVMEYSPDASVITIDQYFEMCKTEYAKYMTEFTVKSESVESKLGKRLAYVYEFDGTVDGVRYSYFQAIAVGGSKLCILTYTATPETYELHRADVERMMSSFEFK